MWLHLDKVEILSSGRSEIPPLCGYQPSQRDRTFRNPSPSPPPLTEFHSPSGSSFPQRSCPLGSDPSISLSVPLTEFHSPSGSSFPQHSCPLGSLVGRALVGHPIVHSMVFQRETNLMKLSQSSTWSPMSCGKSCARDHPCTGACSIDAYVRVGESMCMLHCACLCADGS